MIYSEYIQYIQLVEKLIIRNRLIVHRTVSAYGKMSTYSRHALGKKPRHSALPSEYCGVLVYYRKRELIASHTHVLRLVSGNLYIAMMPIPFFIESMGGQIS